MRRGSGGFTLVEVLVALFAMALMSVIAWQGLDGVLRGHDAGRAAVDRTSLLATLLSQWETDLQQVQSGVGVPASLAWDGRTLRLARRAGDGVQIVAWSLEGERWLRWASAPATTLGPLQQAWLRSQQLASAEPAPVQLLDGVGSFQVFCFRGNAWSNCQSTGDLEAPSAPTNPSTGSTGSTGTAGTTGSSGAPGGVPGSPPPTAPSAEQLPTGVRLVLEVGGQRLTRDLQIGTGS